MGLLAAARLNDPIAHTSMLALIGKVGAGLLVGAVIGFAVGLAASALVGLTVLTGGAALVAAAVVSALIMKVTGASSLIESASNAAGDFLNGIFPPTVEGTIAQGSPDVFINSLPAARAVAEGADNKVACARHGPPQFLAEGSDSVFINSWPAHRKDERTTCDGKTAGGSPNVFIGGDSVQMREITSEMPWWLAQASLLIGVALALCTRDWKSIPGKLACLGVSMAVGAAADWVVDKAFGSPVDAATGAKFLDGSDDEDFALPAALPLTWTRRYNSRDLHEGPLGPGWRLPVSLSLQVGRGPSLGYAVAHVLIDAAGIEIPFTDLGPGTQLLNTAHGWSLGRTESNHWLAQGPDGLYYDFGPSQPEQGPCELKLRRIEDSGGNCIALRYDDAGRLVALADSAKRLYRCDYSAHHPNRIEQVAVVYGAESICLVRYAYDDSGRLSQVINANGDKVREFSWVKSGAGRGLMQSHTLPSGLVCHYDWAQLDTEVHARVVEHKDSAGGHWRAQYILPGAGGQDGHTQVQDVLGRAQHWAWNGRNQITRYDEAMGLPEQRSWTLTWNDAGLLERCTLPNGGVWACAWDERGNLSAQTDPLGASERWSWRVDQALPLSHTDALGHKTSYEWDERDLLMAVTSPAGVKSWQFDERGLVTAQTDERGGISRFMWQTDGQMAVHIDCSGRQTRWSYERQTGQAADWLQSRTDADGQVTRFRHDILGRLVWQEDADGGQQQWTYGADDRLRLWRQGHRQHPGELARSGWRYDALGRVSQFSDASGGVTHWVYDAAGRLQSLRDPLGQETRFTWSAVDALVAQEGADGIKQEMLTDAMGLPIRVSQTGGDGTQALRSDMDLERDVRGRLRAKRTADTLTRYHYDAQGQVLKVERRALLAGHSPEQGPPDWAQLPALDTLELAYSPAGALVEETQTVLALLQTADFLPVAGRSAALQTPTGQWVDVLPEPRVRTLAHAHDALGNTSSTTLPGGQTLQYLRYGSGHLHQINLNGLPLCDFERDALHREVQREQGSLLTQSVLDPLGRPVHRYTQTKGRVLPLMGFSHGTSQDQPQAQVQARLWHRALDANAAVLHKAYRYSPLGELSARADAWGGEQRLAHDALGRLLAQQTLAQPIKGSSPEAVAQRLRAEREQAYRHDPGTVERFEWDAGHNALPAGQGGRVENNRVTLWQDKVYQYDALGRLTHKRTGPKEHPRQTLSLAYNDEGQLVRSTRVQLKTSPQTCRYHYDALGRRIAKQDAFATTWFTWSGMHLLQQERHASVCTWVYEDAQSYAPLAQVRHALKQTQIDPEQVQYFHNDLNGAPEELSDHQGQIVWRVRHMAWGNVARQEWAAQTPPDAKEQPLRYQGQYFDEETGLHYNTFRYYDPDIGRFTSQDPIGLAGGLNLYQYAPNPIAWIDPWGWVNRNSNAAKGHNVLYEVREDSSPNSKILKIGKAKGDDLKSDGSNKRAETSARRARKSGYPNAEAKVVKDLGVTTTGKAKGAEAKTVRTLRNLGHELPLNRENSRSYKANSRPRGLGGC